MSTSKDKKDIIDANVTTGPIQEPHRVTLSPEAKQKLRGEVKTDVSKTYVNALMYSGAYSICMDVVWMNGCHTLIRTQITNY